MGRRALGYGLFGVTLTLLVVGIHALTSRPALQVWHTVDLDEEFTRASDVKDFAGYLKLEDRLFTQLENKVYQKTGPAGADSINRYQHGSRVDPTAMQPNWNRSFELRQDHPTAGVLLLHGLSDSPYSLRHLGESFHATGATVMGLRLPGHGTAPAGLVEVKWQDWTAAVRLAVKHLRGTVGDQPLYVVGYSNGGALAVNYALECLDEPSLPRVAGLVLISPEIGLSPAAALAVWQGRVGHWLGLEKLAWDSIGLEYDPYKYGSFAVNAGDQAYRITKQIDKRLGKMAKAGKLAKFPPLIAFQSAIDATVSAPDLVTRLFDRLPPNGHELVLFDMNHIAEVDHLLAGNPTAVLDGLLKQSARPYALSIITNRGESAANADVFLRRRVNGGKFETSALDLSWPDGVYSLSHIALPFPISDPWYGAGRDGKLTLGNLALRGERGGLRISPADMLRQRWNPFFPYLLKRAHEFCKLPRTEMIQDAAPKEN